MQIYLNMETKLHLYPIDFEQFSFLETITVINTSEQRGTRNVVWDVGYDEIKLKILMVIL